MGQYRKTVNIYCGKNLLGKSREDIFTAILEKFQNVVAVQQNLDVICVTFKEEEQAFAAL